MLIENYMLFEKIQNLPEIPWVYIFKTKWWKVLYVWKAKNLKKRVSQYFSSNIGVWKEDMISRADDIDWIVTQTEEEALLLENNLIKKYQPPYNSLLKWDTGYVYIKIDTKWWEYIFPQIKFTRYKENDWSIYIWPKPWKKDLKKLLQFLRYIFQFRTCSNTQFKKWKLCSDYTFGLCKGRCVMGNKSEELLKKIWRKGMISDDENQKITDNNHWKIDFVEAKEEYSKIVGLLVEFFKWNTEPVGKLILSEVEKAVEKQNFERAARLRDIYMNIQKFVEKQSVVLDENINWYYFLIKKIWDFVWLVLVKFFNWKLIDIVKLKQNEDLQAIIRALKDDIWDFKIFEQNENLIIGWTNKYFFQDIKDFLINQLESLIINSSFEKENLLNEILNNIKDKLSLKNYPYKIQALDISHLSWWRISGAIVTFLWWIPYKKGYRRYKIKFADKSDDYGALKEVLIRRFKLNKNIDIQYLDLPDLFLIDWWKWQLNVVLELASVFPKMKEILEKVDFVSIWKWESRSRGGKLKWEKEMLYFFDENWNIQELQIDNLDFSILQKARDEAHRFANKYRQKQMSMEWK